MVFTVHIAPTDGSFALLTLAATFVMYRTPVAVNRCINTTDICPHNIVIPCNILYCAFLG